MALPVRGMNNITLYYNQLEVYLGRFTTQWPQPVQNDTGKEKALQKSVARTVRLHLVNSPFVRLEGLWIAPFLISQLRMHEYVVPADQDYTLGMFEPGDALGVSRLTCTLYGDSHPFDYVYDPVEVARLFRLGVAVRHDRQIGER